MMEASGTLKDVAKKIKKDLPTAKSMLYYASTPVSVVNSSRLSLMSSARLQKITSNSSEKLTFVSEKDESCDLEKYRLEYSTYLLRKVQSLVLIKNKKEKEENLKKCYLSLKWELEELLKNYLNLTKQIGYFKIFLEIIKESNQKIQSGRNVLKILMENDFKHVLLSLSSSLDHSINQLHLVDIDKALIDEVFRKSIWGSGSEIEECLKKIDVGISKNKNEVSKIASELVEIKRQGVENILLQERFYSTFEKISSEVLEISYDAFTSIVIEALDQRKGRENISLSSYFNCDLKFLNSGLKL